jgi:hypothetical protein
VAFISFEREVKAQYNIGLDTNFTLYFKKYEAILFLSKNTDAQLILES